MTKKLLYSLIVTLSVTGLFGQESQTFRTYKMNLNVKGERIQSAGENPTLISYDTGDMLLRIETDSPDIKELMENRLTRKIEEKLGDLDNQFSLRLEGNMFVHFYLDSRKMIVFTRNDAHPLQWGMMFKEVEEVTE